LVTAAVTVWCNILAVHLCLVNCMGRYPVSSTHCDTYVRSTDEPYRDPTRYGPTVTAVSSRRSAIHYIYIMQQTSIRNGSHNPACNIFSRINEPAEELHAMRSVALFPNSYRPVPPVPRRLKIVKNITV
jgi:hypothetical protein